MIHVHDKYSCVFTAGTEIRLVIALENTDKASMISEGCLFDFGLRWEEVLSDFV